MTDLPTDTTPATLVQALTEFGDDCGFDYQAFGELPEEALVILLAAIRDCRASLAALYADVERDLITIAGAKRFVVEDIGEVVIRKSTKRTQWRHDELLPAVIARVMDEPATIFDEETGELLPYTTIGHNVAQRLRECVSLGAGKVTGLRAIGLQPDEFCREESAGWSVSLPASQVDRFMARDV